MKIFITGASGFVGSNFTNKLLKSSKHKIYLLLRSPTKSKLKKSKNLKIFIGDIVNMNESTRKAIIKCEVIVNFAALIPGNVAKNADFWQTNVNGVSNMLTIACKSKVLKHFIQISTVSVMEKNNFSPYAETKRQAEKLVNLAYLKYKLPTSIIRPAIVYGPGDRHQGFLSLFSTLAKYGIGIKVGSGNNNFHLCYVDNLSDAILKIIGNNKAIGKTFVIGDEPCPTMNMIVSSVARITDKKLFILRIPKIVALISDLIFTMHDKLHIKSYLSGKRISFLAYNRKFDISDAKRVLKWRPQIGLDQGIERSLEYIRNPS